MNGVLVVDKPAEFTSFDVVAVVRRLSGQRKIGHTGTLDPNATGVLPLLLGNTTRAQDIIPNHDKEYVAEFRLGITTDTLDIWGEVKSERKSVVTKSEIDNIIKKYTGEIEQIPPMFSAVSVNGQRLYDLARKGVEVERKPRKITVYELELLGFDENSQSGSIRVKCSRGTYIRTLIDDIGAELGSGAVMTTLRRTMACGFELSGALTLDEIIKLSQSGELEGKLMSTESLFYSYPELYVTDAQAKRFYNGGELDCSRTRLADKNVADGSIYRIKGAGSFLGLGIIKENNIKIYKRF
ncbi:MAG: tRNA pseudouridine(55) synthase TruB [Ruminococcus sp.]|nr:tRNA pseudouridine(55) synthase TruB [Ruminococcus sp.]